MHWIVWLTILLLPNCSNCAVDIVNRLTDWKKHLFEYIWLQAKWTIAKKCAAETFNMIGT